MMRRGGKSSPTRLSRSGAIEYLETVRHPSQMKIGARLTTCFVVIAFLMLLGDAVALWQFSLIRLQVQRLSQVDEKQLAVLRVHTHLLTLRDGLEALIDSENASRLSVGAAPLRKVFLDDVERAKHALSAPDSAAAQDPRLMIMMEAVESVLPAQFNTIINLASAGDWEAVRLRLENQLNALRSVTSAAVESVDREVKEQRAQTLDNIGRVEQRVHLILAIAAFLTLLTALALGFAVTRSITRPLARLDEGARALARSEFQHEVAVTGKDELATLADVFNYAAQQLHEFYAALSSELGERRKAEQQILALNERLINAQEEERARIARELHDDFSQQIAVLSIGASNLKQLLRGEKNEAGEQVMRLQHNLSRLAASARHLSHQLHPAVLEHAGLAAALRAYCAEFTSLGGVHVTFSAEGAFDDMPPAAALCIYRVTQEALQNVAKHAATSEAEVLLTRLNSLVTLIVSDHGAGCSVDRIGAARGLGLVSMKERVRLVNGTFEFVSEPHRGTTVKAIIVTGPAA